MKNYNFKKSFLILLYPVLALFAILVVFVTNLNGKVHALSKTVDTLADLKAALSSTSYDEIILSNSITLTNNTVIDGDLDEDGKRKIIRAQVTGTSDQGIINSDASNYTLFFVANGATVTIKNCIIKGGSQGAICNGAARNSTNNNSILYIDTCQISNSGSKNLEGGAGVENTPGCKVVMTNSSIYRNVAQYGAGFHNSQGTFIMDRCSVSENRSFTYGGAGGENTGNKEKTGRPDAKMYVYNSTIANNVSQEIGGGLNNCKYGYLYLINSTIAGNATTGEAGFGGGVANNDSTLECYNCTIADNVYLGATNSDSDIAGLNTTKGNTGNAKLEGCVYSNVIGITNSEVDVDSSCSQITNIKSIYAATTTGAMINEAGEYGNETYNQVALIPDENGVPYVALCYNSKALVKYNDELTTIPVLLKYDDLNNIVIKKGDECGDEYDPNIAGVGRILGEDERIVTITVRVNADFSINGGSVYGDSYIINTTEGKTIELSAATTFDNQHKSVIWTHENTSNGELTILSCNNPYEISTDPTSDIMTSSWDEDKNAYDIVIRPLTFAVTATSGAGKVTLDWSINTQGKTLTNQVSSYDVYYSIIDDFDDEDLREYVGNYENNITSTDVTSLENEFTYYFWVIPRFGSEEVSGKSIGYVMGTPLEGSPSVFYLANDFEPGRQYLIVSTANAGNAYALKNNGTNNGSSQSVTIANGTVKNITTTDASLVWTLTKSGLNYYLVNNANGTRYITLTANNTIISTTKSNITINGNSGSVQIKNGNYYLRINNNISRTTTQTNLYLFAPKAPKNPPVDLVVTNQQTMNVDSGKIEGVTTDMEYSTDCQTWTACTATVMNNVEVGKYYFRYAETTTTYASGAVAVEVKEKNIDHIEVTVNPTLTYTAGEELDLSSLKIKIYYNNDTTKEVLFNKFSSTASSDYERASGTITTSIANETELACSNNGSTITVTLDGKTASTSALTINHDLELVSKVDPTCTEEGSSAYYKCSSCNKMFNEAKTLELDSIPTIDALGHDKIHHDKVDSTCTVKGHKAYDTCSRCDYSTYEELELADHDYNDWEIDENATCTTAGSKSKACKNCTHKEYEAIPALGHSYGNATYTWDTDNSKCSAEATCSRCSNKINETVDSTMTKVDPTCTTDGLETYKAVFTDTTHFTTQTKKVVLNALGHDYGAWVVELEPTYETDGSKYRVCSRCSDKETQVIPKLSHTHVYSDDYLYDNTNHWKECSCGDKKDLEAHSLTEWIIDLDPTCLEKGLKHKKCTICGYIIEEEINALGHDYGEWIVELEPTYDTDGSKYRVCSRCSNKENAIIPKLSHTHDFSGDYQYDEYNHWKECSCGEKNSIESHDFGEWIIDLDPTCKAIGLKHRICEICGYTQNDTIAKLDHDLIHHEGLNPTKKDKGYEAYDTCSRCDYSTYKEIDALGYDYKFYRDYELLLSVHGLYGEKIIVPSLDKEYVTGNYTYEFVGWDKEIPNELNDDYTFNAIYRLKEIKNDFAIIRFNDDIILNPNEKLVIVKVIDEKEIENKNSSFEHDKDYDDFEVTELFEIYLEVDGIKTYEYDETNITIIIDKKNLNNIEKDSKLFYIDGSGNKKEINFTEDDNYITFEVNTLGNYTLASEGDPWLLILVLVVESLSLCVMSYVLYSRIRNKKEE